MMDAYNLAICFGPTLMPAPEDKDQVQYQNQVNDLIKNMIVFHDDLFPKDLGGTIYEKYISQEPFDCDVGDSPTDQATEDPDSEVYPSEDGNYIINFYRIFFSIANDNDSNWLKFQNRIQWKQQFNSISMPGPIVNCLCEKVI